MIVISVGTLAFSNSILWTDFGFSKLNISKLEQIFLLLKTRAV